MTKQSRCGDKTVRPGGAGRHCRAICPQRWAALTVTVSSVLLMASCSGKPQAAIGSGDTSSAAALGSATFSALIDGEPVSGGAIDDLQQQNAAYSVPGSDGQSAYLLFYLFDAKVPNDPHFSHSFRLYLPKQVGTASNAHLTVNIILDPDHSARYSNSSPSITITSLTDTRVSGTFSGKMTVSPDTPNVPKQVVTVSDGKFDIPMATSSLIPP